MQFPSLWGDSPPPSNPEQFQAIPSNSRASGAIRRPRAFTPLTGDRRFTASMLHQPMRHIVRLFLYDLR